MTNKAAAAMLVLGIALGAGGVALTAACSTPTPSDSPNTKTAHRPADGDRATGPVTDYDDGVLFCGTNAGVATDIDPYGNAWAYCEPALAEGN